MKKQLKKLYKLALEKNKLELALQISHLQVVLKNSKESK